MTTQPPSPEAVEAAMKWARDCSVTDKEICILGADDPYSYGTDTAARILADEVERLRAQAGAVCEATIYPKRIGPVVVFTSLQACGAIHSCGDRPIDYVKNPYCPGCGRKVKIQPQTTTNNQ